MNKEELREYRDELVSRFGEPVVVMLDRRDRFLNGKKTSDRIAYKGIPWIDYYRAITDNATTIFKCAGCGRTISTDDDIVDMNSDVHEAFGGHILVWDNLMVFKYFIVPLCPKCNNSKNDIIRLVEDTIAVEEVGATILSDESENNC